MSVLFFFAARKKSAFVPNANPDNESLVGRNLPLVALHPWAFYRAVAFEFRRPGEGERMLNRKASPQGWAGRRCRTSWQSRRTDSILKGRGLTGDRPDGLRS